MRAALKILFPFVPGVLVLAFALTIIGSITNNDSFLTAGVIAWLAGCFLLFAWLVLFMWGRRSRYHK